MKVCPVCKSAVPDDAEYCETCGNDEFFDGGYPQQFEQPYQDESAVSTAAAVWL